MKIRNNIPRFARDRKIILFATFFGVVGMITLANIFAATAPNAKVLEAENYATGQQVTVVTDGSASNNAYVEFRASTGSTCPNGQIGSPPNCVDAPPAPTSGGKSWQLVFNDEFNGSSLDTTKLTPCFDWNTGNCTATFNQGRERYIPSQVQVSNGTAKLVAEPLSPAYASSACLGGSCTYKAGLLSTARPRADNGSDYLFPFTYGYIESRMKYPGVSGFFTAFWMLPTDPTYSYATEIDIVEILGGEPQSVFMTYHYNDRNDSHSLNNGRLNNGACPVKDYSKDFVRFGLDWQPTYIAWYIDGVKCGQFNGNSSTIESGPMQVILHMMIDHKWQRDWGLTLANQSLAATLEVDYLRIYQQK